jgi:hypothetical protein
MCLATVPPEPGGGIPLMRIILREQKRERKLGEADARGTAWAIYKRKKAEARWFSVKTGMIFGFLCDEIANGSREPISDQFD